MEAAGRRDFLILDAVCVCIVTTLFGVSYASVYEQTHSYLFHDCERSL